MCHDRRVDDQQHPHHCKKKNAHLMFTLYRRRWRKNQAMISSVILDGFIMVLMRRIEEEEVISGCIVVERWHVHFVSSIPAKILKLIERSTSGVNISE